MLTIQGQTNEQVQTIEAYVSYTDSSGKEQEQILGQCKVITYDNTANELVVVPLNEATAPGASELQQKLNKVYKVSLASWNVTVEDAFEIDQSQWDVKEEDGELGYEAAGRKYSKEMRKIYQHYKTNREVESNKYYLFLTDFPVKNTLNSYMPFKGQFAFISTQEVSSEDLPRVAAHELGHGTFRLYHTFSDKSNYPVARGTTDNLMDYNDGEELHKYQWDYVQDPQGMWFTGLIDEEEGASHDVEIEELISWINENKGTYANLKRKEFYNFDVWVNKALKIELNGKNTMIYSEVFEDGKLDLRKPNVDFIINKKYHSSFSLSFKYKEKSNDAIRLWTYSYSDFKKLLEELGYSLTENMKNEIISNYKAYLNNYGKDCNKIDVVFETIPDFVLSEISLKKRVDYLSVLTECQVMDGGWIWGKNRDTDEKEAISNLLDVSENNFGDLLTLISKKKNSKGVYLFQSLIEEIGHDEFTMFAGDILRWFNKEVEPQKISEDFQVIYWNDKSFKIWDDSRAYSFNSKGKINLKITTKWLTPESIMKINEEYYSDLKPLEPIGVKIEKLDNVETHSKRVIPGMKEGDEYVMPAIVFIWMAKHHDKLENQELAETAIMAASLFVNVRSLSTAGSVLAKTFATGTIILNTADVFYGNENVRNKIDANWIYGSEFLDIWDKIIKNYSRATFSYSTIKGNPKLFNKFKTVWDELISSNIDVKTTIGNDNFQTINDFCSIKFKD
jgi:hypothetical protein